MAGKKAGVVPRDVLMCGLIFGVGGFVGLLWLGAAFDRRGCSEASPCQTRPRVHSSSLGAHWEYA
jgi:hypothetical protein